MSNTHKRDNQQVRVLHFALISVFLRLAVTDESRSPLDTEKCVTGISAGIKFSLDAIKFVSFRSEGVYKGGRGEGEKGHTSKIAVA